MTYDRGRKIAIQIDLKKHKVFIQEYLEFIEDKKDIDKTAFEETIPFEEVVSRFEDLIN